MNHQLHEKIFDFFLNRSEIQTDIEILELLDSDNSVLIEVVRDELMESYFDGLLSDEDRTRFELYFLSEEANKKLYQEFKWELTALRNISKKFQSEIYK